MSTLNKPLSTDVIRFTVTTRTLNGNTVYQAIGNIGSGWGPAAVQRVDGKVTFPNRRAIVKAIKRRAEALNMRPEIKYVRTKTVTRTKAGLPTTTKKRKKTDRASVAVCANDSR